MSSRRAEQLNDHDENVPPTAPPVRAPAGPVPPNVVRVNEDNVIEIFVPNHIAEENVLDAPIYSIEDFFSMTVSIHLQIHYHALIRSIPQLNGARDVIENMTNQSIYYQVPAAEKELFIEDYCRWTNTVSDELAALVLSKKREIAEFMNTHEPRTRANMQRDMERIMLEYNVREELFAEVIAPEAAENRRQQRRRRRHHNWGNRNRRQDRRRR